MPSPIFSTLFIKKYVVQTRSKYSDWKEYGAYTRLEQAKRVAREIIRQNSEAEVRIFNRLTSQVVRNWIIQK